MEQVTPKMQRVNVEKCVLFADIAGSTQMYDKHGDEATQKLLVQCLDMMAEIVVGHRGTVVRRIGDELLCTFPTAEDAAAAASTLQTRVSDGHLTGYFSWPVRLRIGFEYGPFIEEGGALFGAVVHEAARLASLAKAGQTLTSENTLGLLNPAYRCFSRFHDTVMFKGISGERRVHELLWRMPQLTVARRPATPAPRPAGVRGVDLEYEGRAYHVGLECPRIEIGRDASCDIRVAGAAVSQLHARIIWNQGEVQIEDLSTNGTVVESKAAGRVLVHHGKASLKGTGVIHLGDAPEVGGALLSYRCDATAS